MVIESKKNILSDTLFNIFKDDGRKLFESNEQVRDWFDKWVNQHYNGSKNDDCNTAFDNFKFTYGLLSFFTRDVTADYFLNEFQLKRVVPIECAEFIDGLFSLKCNIFPVNMYITIRKELSDEEFYILLEKYKLGLMSRLKQYFSTCEQSPNIYNKNICKQCKKELEDARNPY